MFFALVFVGDACQNPPNPGDLMEPPKKPDGTKFDSVG